jgi:hypothetical protein
MTKWNQAHLTFYRSRSRQRKEIGSILHFELGITNEEFRSFLFRVRARSVVHDTVAGAAWMRGFAGEPDRGVRSGGCGWGVAVYIAGSGKGAAEAGTLMAQSPTSQGQMWGTCDLSIGCPFDLYRRSCL